MMYRLSALDAAHVDAARVRATNERLLQALLPHCNAEAALYLRQVAYDMATQQSSGSRDSALRNRIAGDLILAADTLGSTQAAWDAARDNQYGEKVRESLCLQAGMEHAR